MNNDLPERFCVLIPTLVLYVNALRDLLRHGGDRQVGAVGPGGDVLAELLEQSRLFCSGRLGCAKGQWHDSHVGRVIGLCVRFEHAWRRHRNQLKDGEAEVVMSSGAA